jgi:hypothetical protein
MDDIPNPSLNKAPSAIPPGRVVIELEAAGIGAPLVCRIKRLLKASLRAYGLRCVKVDWDDAPPPLAPAQRAQFYKEQFPAAMTPKVGGER